ncbi:aminomethyl-transferring glycine dehydrogenase subunit GcvPA [Desulfovibrio sp. OttesenSCG-928-I05]|nr:aminomethyl-transferring glycine dehydrogenase subunit GcvPA [Desulfovibrio sp. OttesenSCG-928-I05]
MDDNFVHPYMPNSAPLTRKAMLDFLGVSSVEDLYRERINGPLRFDGRMNLPEPILGEHDLKKHVMGILNTNTTCEEYDSFLGAGCYNHHVPAICDEVNSRSEFLTGYCGDTYSDHGKMQAIFEFTSMMGELVDMDVVSYTNYDASQAVSSSLRMAMRVLVAEGHTDRTRFLLPATMHPEVLAQVREYCGPVASIELVGYDKASGLMDLADLRGKLDEGGVAAVFYENPSYLGFFETRAREIANLAHGAGALVVAQPEVSSLGVIESPANYGADIVCGEIQPLGMHMQYGGGCAGFMAAPYEEKYIQQFPTYMYGITTTQNKGEYGWGRALNYRCSHGSRENGNEYFGTETGLWGITAGVYLALMGPEGMRELGEHILQKCAYAIKVLSGVPGIRANRFGGANFQEFVVTFDGKRVADVNAALLAEGIFGGKDLCADFPELGESALYCVTETTSRAQIDRLGAALKKIMGGR